MIELLVTLTIVTIIGASLYSVFRQERMRSRSESDIVDMQVNLRNALERLNFLFSNAGFGCAESFSSGKVMTGDEPQGDDGVTIRSVFQDFTDGNVAAGESDSVIVTLGWRAVGDVYVNATNPANVDDDKVSVNRNKDVNGNEYTEMVIDGGGDAFKNYFSFFPSLKTDDFFELDAVTNKGGKQYQFDFSEDMSFLVQEESYLSKVYLISPVKVMVDSDGGDNYLYLKNYSYNDKGMWQVAKNVENLQLRISSDQKLVEIFLLIRSENTDPDYVDTGTYVMGDETLGPFNDNYHRILSRSTVKVRGRID